MIILGIESATDSLGAAIHAGAESLASIRLSGRRRHAERLPGAIEAVLEGTGTPLRSVEAVAVDVGPGLFTGLRVGLATAKGLAQGLGIGLIGLGSLEVLASAALEVGWAGTVLSVLDARRGEVFAAHFGPGPNPRGPETLAEPSRVRPEALVDLLGEPAVPVLACGDGALRYRALLEEIAAVSFGGPILATPDPATLVRLARSRLDSGVGLVGSHELEACYLREPDTRISWAIRSPVEMVRGG